MKMFKFFAILLFAASTLFMSSCSKDDDSNPVTPTNSTYFVMTTGSHWISDFYKKNPGNEIVTSSLIVDTTKVMGTETFLGKTSTKFLVSSSDGNSKSYHQYFENNVLYSELNLIMPSDLGFIPDSLLPANQWIPLVNSGLATWEVFTQNLPSIPVEVSGFTGVTLSSKLTITGTKGATGTMTFNGTTINTQTFNYAFAIVGALNVPGIAIPVPVTMTLNLRLTYGENVGLVKQEMDSQKLSVSIPIYGNKDIKDINGFVNTCRSYSIK